MTVSATFRKAVSDNNYGNEAAEVTISIEDTPENLGQAEKAAAALLVACRRLVHEELLRSPSPAVASALELSRSMTRRVPVVADEDAEASPEDLPF